MSDHILNQSLDHFAGKRVALIDDTLILGTTLGQTKRLLLAQKAAEVTCHVFAIDDDNWCPPLIMPDRVFMHCEHQQVLSFCAAEVSALLAAGIPYLSDFPISKPVRLGPLKLSILHSIPGWRTHTLTSSRQETSGSATYTILPRPETYEQLRTTLGGTLYNVLEIIKIRVFCRYINGAYWTKFVPIVTVAPLSDGSVEVLFQSVLRRWRGQSEASFANVYREFSHPIGKLRLIQYILSLAVGHACLAALEEALDIKKPILFDIDESRRLFGPWLGSELQEMHDACQLAFPLEAKISEFRGLSARAEALPPVVIKKTKADYFEFTKQSKRRSPGNVWPQNLFISMATAFIELHNKYELPAREEARRLGARIFEVSKDEAPFRDRLKFGFAWRPLVEGLLEQTGLAVTLRRLNLISLVLDHLIDMGIAVPVLCQKDGVLFRAYRYGEDVQFGDQELALAHEIASGYLEKTGRSAIAKIVLEKLLVCLLRVGVANEFLSVIHGLSGGEGVARIGFHLHGAVATVRQQTFFADNQESWLSRYMTNRNVLRRASGGMYALGSKPEAAMLSPRSLGDAKQLGALIGLLSEARMADGRRVLSENDLIVLASCVQPKDAACAIAAELRLFCDWMSYALPAIPTMLEKESQERLLRTLQSMTHHNGYIALHSARMKADGYARKRPALTIKECHEYLETLPHGDLLGAQWKTIWAGVLRSKPTEQKHLFDPWIAERSRQIFLAALGLFTIEAAIVSQLALAPGLHGERLKKTYRKMEAYLTALRPLVEISPSEDVVHTRLMSAIKAGKPIASPGKSVTFGKHWIATRIAGMRASVHRLEDLMKEYGRTDTRTNFALALWYDIIDSKGQRSGLEKAELRDYRSRVRAFKSIVARELHGLSRDAGRASAIVYAWQGPLYSKDDEKHIFFAGPRSMAWLQEAISILIMATESQRVRVRTAALRSDFAGPPAHKFSTEPTVDGEAFWEHFSLIKAELKNMEKDTEGHTKRALPVLSFLWVGGDLNGRLEFSPSVRWHGRRQRRQIKTEVEGNSVRTMFQGGAVAWSPQQAKPPSKGGL